VEPEVKEGNPKKVVRSMQYSQQDDKESLCPLRASLRPVSHRNERTERAGKKRTTSRRGVQTYAHIFKSLIKPKCQKKGEELRSKKEGPKKNGNPNPPHPPTTRNKSAEYLPGLSSESHGKQKELPIWESTFGELPSKNEFGQYWKRRWLPGGGEKKQRKKKQRLTIESAEWDKNEKWGGRRKYPSILSINRRATHGVTRSL